MIPAEFHFQGLTMNDRGHFEKGAWVPGPWERLNRALAEFCESMGKFHAQLAATRTPGGAFYDPGYFCRGVWVPLL